ncbi:dynactin subunit 2 [Phlebotomus argentipes]|uniref:dynactin subunit 2 n=1 Tax=Phlebotomus argentipes TaxID=94469 RepID=UPI00289308CB|nr:dynactin subunit 2 [Phlebotomus argentipes]
MADPKFLNLPGIVYDQPDVYETPDVPEVETSDYYDEDPENSAIECLQLSTKDCFNKFKGKYLKGDVDFSDRISKRTRTGYAARSGLWEINGEGGRETPLQKYRRLQCEMHELLDEMSAIQANAQTTKEEKQSYEVISGVVSSASKILKCLHFEEVLGKETMSKNTELELKKLVTQVEEFKKADTVMPPITDIHLAQENRIAELEHRLHTLEKAIGAKPEKLSRLIGALGVSNLLAGVQQLSAKTALLQPAQLDLLETRLLGLANKMNAVAEKTATTPQESDREAKVMELYKIAKRTEPIVQILPEMVARMQSLEALHKYSSNFSKAIAELEASQTMILTGLSQNKVLLQEIQETSAVQFDNLQKEVKKLEDRLNAIKLPK